MAPLPSLRLSVVIFQRFDACFAKKMLAAGNFAVFRVLVLLRVNFGLGVAFQSSFSTKSIFAHFV